MWHVPNQVQRIPLNMDAILVNHIVALLIWERSYNKSTYDLVERLLFPLSFYRRYIKFKEMYSDVCKFRMIFYLIHLSSI